MARILLQTTIADVPDDWNVERFSLLAQDLRRQGHEVTARIVSGRHFNPAVAVDGELSTGRPQGRAVVCSTFHHFADLNWDIATGAPSFVTDPPGHEMERDPRRLQIFKDYVRNIAGWLS